MHPDLCSCRSDILNSSTTFLARTLCRSEVEKDSFLDLLDDPSVLDDSLDSPQLYHAILESDRTLLSPYLYFYVGLRFHARRHGIRSRELADYVAALCIHYLYCSDWSPESSLGKPKEYLDSLFATLNVEKHKNNLAAAGTLYVHIGNYSLFLTGLLPQVVRQKQVEGEYSLEHYVSVGKKSYQAAAALPSDLQPLFGEIAESFDGLRDSLADLASSYLA